MDYSKLKSLFEEVLNGQHDKRFTEVTNAFHCMSRPRVYAVLNAVVSSMEMGELYVEVGTYQGGSLISALLDNTSKAIGVDNFGEFKETNDFQQTLDHLKDFGMAGRVELMNMGFAEFFAQLPKDQKIQVYYYDGTHDYETQLAGMEAAWSHLIPGSIVMVDDYTYSEVSHAINQFVANHLQNIKFQFVMLPTESIDDIWWNGCVVLKVT